MRARSLMVLAALCGASSAGCEGFPEEPPLSLRVLYPEGGKGDRGFADSVASAVEFGRWQFTLDVEEAAPETLGEAEATLARWLNQPYPPQLVVTVGEPYDQLVAARDCDFGTSRVLHLDTLLGECDGLQSVAYDTYDPAFAAGASVLALAPRGRVGAIGGTDIEPVRALLEAFRDGAESAGGEVAPFAFVADDFTGFDDVAAAEVLADEMYDSVDVILAATGGATLGVVQAAAVRSDAYVVGVDGDWSLVDADVVVASVLKRLDFTVREAMFDVVDGTFESGAFVSGEEEGGTELLINIFYERALSPPAVGSSSSTEGT